MEFCTCVAPMVDLNVTVEYERLKVESDGTSSTLSCTTTSGMYVCNSTHNIMYVHKLFNLYSLFMLQNNNCKTDMIFC